MLIDYNIIGLPARKYCISTLPSVGKVFFVCNGWVYQNVAELEEGNLQYKN